MVYTGRLKKQHSTIDKHVLYSTTVSYRKREHTRSQKIGTSLCICIHWTRSPQLHAIEQTIAIN